MKEITEVQAKLLKGIGMTVEQIKALTSPQLNVLSAGLFVQAPQSVQKDTLGTLEGEVEAYKKECASKLAGKLLAAFKTVSDNHMATFKAMFEARPTLAKNKSDSKVFSIISKPVKIEGKKYTYRVSVSISPIVAKENQGQNDGPPPSDPDVDADASTDANTDAGTG